jgi:hypothetical protein
MPTSNTPFERRHAPYPTPAHRRAGAAWRGIGQALTMWRRRPNFSRPPPGTGPVFPVQAGAAPKTLRRLPTPRPLPLVPELFPEEAGRGPGAVALGEPADECGRRDRVTPLLYEVTELLWAIEAAFRTAEHLFANPPDLRRPCERRLRAIFAHTALRRPLAVERR